MNNFRALISSIKAFNSRIHSANTAILPRHAVQDETFPPGEKGGGATNATREIQATSEISGGRWKTEEFMENTAFSAESWRRVVRL